LREDYLAIVTIGFSEIVGTFLLNEEWLTEGPYGLYGFDKPFGDWVSHDNYTLVFLAILVVTLGVVYFSLQRLVKSPWGRVLKSIREDEEVASALGKNVFSYKIQSLVLGSAIAGLAGAFLAFHLQYINPRSFLSIETFYAWIIVVLGGTASNKGTIVGALILWAFLEGTRFMPDFFPIEPYQEGALRIMIIGLLLMLLMMHRPQGILGTKEELTLDK